MSAPLAPSQRNKYTLFMTGVPVDATEESLRNHIKQIDSTIQIKGMTLLRAHETMQLRGNGFIDLISAEDSMRLRCDLSS